MRQHILAAFILMSAPVAWAQNVVAPPAEPAPTASAPIEERVAWCDDYATWLVMMSPDTQRAAPTDIRQTQHLEVELNSCRLDPAQYERETRAEADHAIQLAQG